MVRHAWCPRLAAALLLTLPLVTTVPLAGQAPPAVAQVTLERIMAHPDWIGTAPEDAFWADDGESFFYYRKVVGEERRDLWEMSLAGESQGTVTLEARGSVDAPGGDWSSDRSRKVYEREGDVFFKDLATGRLYQLTRTAERERSPRFLVGDTQVSFRRGDTVLVRDLVSGLESQVAELRLEDDPAEEEDEPDYLRDQQERLLRFIADKKAKAEAEREREREERAADPTRVPPPWYLGKDTEIRGIELAPTGRHLLLVLGEADEDEGKRDAMPNYITESGYVESREVRPKVGTGKRKSERLVILDLDRRERRDLDLGVLPGIDEDPLADIKAATEKRRRAAESPGEAILEEDLEPWIEEGAEELAGGGEGEDGKAKRSLRAVSFWTVGWNDAGTRAVVQAFSHDNKDRWTATLDLTAGSIAELELAPLHRLHDEAWVGWAFNEVGWLPDGDRLYLLSEETGYSQLYLANAATGEIRQLTGVLPAPPEEVDAGADAVPSAEPAPPAAEPVADDPAAAEPVAEEPPADPETQRGLLGRYVVRDVEVDAAGSALYYVANPDHPGIYEVYRVGVDDGEIEQLTDLDGMTSYVLSPDERHLLLTHSKTTAPPELYLQPIAERPAAPAADPAVAVNGTPPPTVAAPPGVGGQEPGAAEPAPPPPARRVTRTVSDEFAAIDWVEPEIVAVPSTHVERPIYSRLYLPESFTASAGGAPAVLFVHGAGYLQNAHQGWSGYFREFMFHTFLARRGYVVLDMDYRASAGYGRDWRTAIYRHMGGPELEDLEDGVAWLAREHGVDPRRVGVYGGSYGGFLTMMALFTRPDLFQAGAALRPVTDWAHYNHPYTSNILNTPDVDPGAYERSSPIEFAEGLAKPLLICAPMQDDNVLFLDVVRLVQRLIELEKEDFEVAIYPVEPHGFREPSSWLDEYRRIFKLFERTVK